MLYVDVKTVTATEDGLFTVVLACDGVEVQCEGVAWFDAAYDEDELIAVFEEWQDLALEPEEGYTFVGETVL